MPSALRVVVAAVGGLVTYLAYPRIDAWWCAPIGVALLVLATHRIPGGARRVVLWGALLGAVYATALHLPLIGWTGIFLGWLPRGALTALMALYGAVCGAGLAVVSQLRLTHPLGAAVRALGLAGWWVVSEAVASRFPFGGFGWSRLAFSQTDAPTVALASLGGVPLVSFAVALAGTTLATSLLSALGATSTRSIITAGTVGALGALGTLCVGLVVPLAASAQNGTINVVGVQGNVPRAGLDFNAQRRQVLDWHARATLTVADQVKAGTRPQPDLVIWPENASDIDPFTNADAYQVIDHAVEAVNATTLVGGLVRAASPASEPPVVENSSIQWTPGQGPGHRYVKQLPVPFVEYVPFRAQLQPLIPMLEMAGNMAKGSTVGLFEVPVKTPSVQNGQSGLSADSGQSTRMVPVGALICFEVVSDSVVRETVASGAQFVALQTNNATFGYTAESEQQLALMRLRAVEHGRTFAQVSTVGVSAFAFPDGTLSEPTALFTTDAITADVALRTSPTIATRLGAAPELALAAGGMLAGTAAAARRSTW